MRGLRVTGAVATGFGALLAIAMYILMQYSASQRPTSVPLVPGALFLFGLGVVAVGLLLFLIAVLVIAARRRNNS